MLKISIILGFALGVLEYVILLASKQKLDPWIYVQSVLFWFTAGIMIGLVDSRWPGYMTGALIGTFLALPWFINISIIPKQYGHLIPLIISSLLLGALGGYLKDILVARM